ncbi:TPA: hypothetical protein VAP34_001989 [Streptococcus agalactiae]|nr:hypothetical protein [Streptococcus agalactiae]
MGQKPKFLRLNIQFFSDSTNSGADDQNTDPAANPEDSQSSSGGNTQQTSQEDTKLFKQEEVNNIAAKEAKKAQEKLLKQLGVSDFKSAKEGLDRLKEIQDSQKTEAEKQAELLKEFETNNQTLTSENETLKAQISAMKAGVKADSVADVVTLAQNLLSDDTDMAAAIQKVVEKYPHFAEQDQEETEKPHFTNGQHQKQSPTELDAWTAAFKK